MNNTMLEDSSLSFLSNDNIERLKHIFGTKEEYKENMKVIWALRALSHEVCDKHNDTGLDFNNPIFKIYKLTNDLISALLKDGFYFTVTSENVCCYEIYNHENKNKNGRPKDK